MNRHSDDYYFDGITHHPYNNDGVVDWQYQDEHAAFCEDRHYIASCYPKLAARIEACESNDALNVLMRSMGLPER